MEDFTIRVPYRDVTVGNHVFYARYLDYLEVARNEIFRGIGHTLKELEAKNIIFPVVECTIKYFAPARYDDLLTLSSSFTHVGKVQFTLDYQIKRGDTLLATATTRHAVTTLSEKPVRLPPDLLAAIQLRTAKSSDL